MGNIRRPTEEALELELSILRDKFRKDGLQPPPREVLVPIARHEVEIRRAREQRQEDFNRKQGWGNRPFVNLKLEVSQ